MIVVTTRECVSEILLHVNTIISVINVNDFHLILTKFAFKYHTKFDTVNDKWNAISSTICFDDMLNYFLQQTIYYPKLMVILLHLTSLMYLKPWQTDKVQN